MNIHESHTTKTRRDESSTGRSPPLALNQCENVYNNPTCDSTCRYNSGRPHLYTAIVDTSSAAGESSAAIRSINSVNNVPFGGTLGIAPQSASTFSHHKLLATHHIVRRIKSLTVRETHLTQLALDPLHSSSHSSPHLRSYLRPPTLLLPVSSAMADELIEKVKHTVLGDKHDKHAVPSNIEVLFQPTSYGALQARNRFVYAPMTRNRGYIPSPINVDYYRKYATECGLMITEGTVTEVMGSEWPYAPGIFSKEQVAGWKKVADAVHAEGSLLVMQLWHLGRVVHPLHQGGKPNVGPSAVQAAGGKFRLLQGSPGYQTPVAIDDPEQYIEQHKQAAINAKAAGMDGVQLHSANGYLSHQFIDTSSNRRTDKWGGSVENRCRFTLRIVDELCEVWGSGRVGVKLSPCGGYNDVGMDRQSTLDTYSYLIRQLNQRNIAFLELHRRTPGFYMPGRACEDVDTVTELAPLATVPVILNGGYTASDAADAVESGGAKGISFGRPYLANPDLPTRFRHGIALNTPDPTTFYIHPEGAISVGYTDYPFAGMKPALDKLAQ